MAPRPDESPYDQFTNGRISLKEYLDYCQKTGEELHNKDIALVQARIDAIEKAVALQDTVTQERLHHHNLFREQIERERAELVRKADVLAIERALGLRFQAMEDKADLISASRTKALESFESRLANMEGRWLATVTVGGFLFSIISGVIAVVAIFNL